MKLNGKPVIFFTDIDRTKLRLARRRSSFGLLSAIRSDPNGDYWWIAEGLDTSYLAVFDGLYVYKITHADYPNDYLKASMWASRVRAWEQRTGKPKLWIASPDRPAGMIWTRTAIRPNRMCECPRSSHRKDRQDGAFYQATFNAAVKSKPDWLWVHSFNEWVEGTYIEPSVKYRGQVYANDEAVRGAVQEVVERYSLKKQRAEQLMQLTPGQLVNNRYHILRLLGQGGMGAVYLAEDNNLPGRQVAVKENADPSQSAQDQFKREAVILARLKHPNLPQVTDHFLTPSGSQYLVMDYVPGEDLDKILTRRGPLPEAEVVGWMVQVFDALEYMHTWVDPTTGMLTPAIHRDIKPGNIKLTPQGRIMLVDFGIAKFQGGTGTLTGARAASPGFSPVEQYTGGTDVRTDIYALGATMYCLLTGRIPPEAPELAAGRVQLKAPRALIPGLTPITEGAILRAMQLQSPNRFQSVHDLRQALAGGSATSGAQQTCASCGTANRSTAKFCNKCGGSLPGTRPPQGSPSKPTVAQSSTGSAVKPGVGAAVPLKQLAAWCAGARCLAYCWATCPGYCLHRAPR